MLGTLELKNAEKAGVIGTTVTGQMQEEGLIIRGIGEAICFCPNDIPLSAGLLPVRYFQSIKWPSIFSKQEVNNAIATARPIWAFDLARWLSSEPGRKLLL